MHSLKQKIRRLLPDRMIYIYYVIKKMPSYFKSLFKNRNDKYPDLKFYSDVETVNKIISERKSLSRFGDGELTWMTGESLDSFQDYSEEFSSSLRAAFQSVNPDLMIGLPIGLVDSSKCNLYAKMHWQTIRADFFDKLMLFANLSKIYCNASITRPYIDYKSREYSKSCFENLKRIWNNRDVVFVEGEKTKLGMGNDLFDNAKTVKRIVCPAMNAYEKIDEIKKSIVANVDKNTLILTALGPTASILAADMCDLGYQIIDIGHIDIEYWWYTHNSILRDEVPGKYVNESFTRHCSNDYDNNALYLDSIIDRII